MPAAAENQESLRRLRRHAGQGQWLGDAIHWLAETSSTNDDCRRLSAASPGRSVVLLADRQTAGRGQYGRVWDAPPGLGLLMSVSVVETPCDGALLTAWAAAATAQMLERHYGLAARVKWPNDVLVGGRKIAGVLVEVRDFAVVGIGLNVLQQPEQFPPDCRLPPTSIALETGRTADRVQVAAALLEELERLSAPAHADARDAILDAWRSRLDVHPGRSVRATWNEGSLVGDFMTLDPLNGLRLRTNHGVVRIPAARLLRVESAEESGEATAR